MPRLSTIPVYLERGEKRTFACAVDWPGWSRSGRDEASALQALLDAGPRYANRVPVTFVHSPPADPSRTVIG